MKFLYNYMNNFAVSFFWKFNLRVVWGTSVFILAPNAESNSVLDRGGGDLMG